AKVQENDVILIRQLQVLRLDIAMDDRRLMRMKVSQGVKQLVCPEHHPADGKRLIRGLEPRRKIVTRDVFHHEILIAAINEMVADLRKDRMPEACKDPRLALERTGKGRVACIARPLKGNGAAKPLIDSKIDLAHSAFADQMNDQVAILDHCIWGQRVHFVFGWQITSSFLR